jgi:hypothetical protein
MGAVHARMKYVHHADFFPCCRFPARSPLPFIVAHPGRRALFISPSSATAIARRDFSWEHLRRAWSSIFAAPSSHESQKPSAASKFISFFHATGMHRREIRKTGFSFKHDISYRDTSKLLVFSNLTDFFFFF